MASNLEATSSLPATYEVSEPAQRYLVSQAFALGSLLTGFASFAFMVYCVWRNATTHDGLQKIITASSEVLITFSAMALAAIILGLIGSRFVKTAAFGKAFGMASVVTYALIVPAAYAGSYAEWIIAALLLLFISASPVLVPAGIAFVIFLVVRKLFKVRKAQTAGEYVRKRDMLPWRKWTDLSFLSVLTLFCNTLILGILGWAMWFVWSLSQK